MSSDFLTGLANQLGSQFSVGENQDRSVDIAQDGTAQRYGRFGDFANQFDQSEQRTYLQEGYLKYNYLSATPKQLEVLMQEPDITVLVKKRMFCSLADNYDMTYMDQDEKLFYKASKILFANKANRIATYEALSKIERVSSMSGYLPAQLIPLIISLTGDLGGSLGISTNDNTENSPDTEATGTDPSGGGLTKLQSVLRQIQEVNAFGFSNFYTTWLSDTIGFFRSQYAYGTGVLEFCNVTGVNTQTTLSYGGGNFSLNISDPYNMMIVTNDDIEQALSDATNLAYTHPTFLFGQTGADALVASNTQKLNDLRARRGATDIQFISDPNTFIGKRVQAIFGSGNAVNFTYNAAGGLGSIVPGGGVTISPESFRGGPIVGADGLDNTTTNSIVDPDTGVAIRTLMSTSEASLFCEVIENMYSAIQIQNNSQNIQQLNSSLTNYSRRKMRMHFLGKSVIQPMDEVHIYIGSKTSLDQKLLGGLQNSLSGLGFLQSFNNISAGIVNQFDALFNPEGNANFQLEKAVFVGADFPNWLWTMLRTLFINETSGSHVFGGVAGPSESSFGNGAYTLTVSGPDMLTAYLSKGKVNIKPSVSVFNGPLYDPLTPFKTTSNSITNEAKSSAADLLDENKALLSTNLVKYKAGPLAGKSASEQNLQQQDHEHDLMGNIRQVFYHPDGLVYKWKEGIGTLTQFSNSMVVQNNNTVSSPALTVDPFAGQSVMNAISLSITGKPYDFATFWKAAVDSGNAGRDPQSGQDAASSFYKSLSANFTKNNVLWGNYIPFQTLSLDDATYQAMQTAQISVQKANDQINTALQNIQVLTSQLQFLAGAGGAISNNTTASTAPIISNLKNQIQTQLGLLKTQYAQIRNQLITSDGQGLTIVGDDVSFDYDDSVNTDPGNNSSLTDSNIRRGIRRKVNFLTRRLSYQVRANEDKNLLIVDDSYAKDYDIQAFEKKLDSLKAFDSEYVTVFEKVKSIGQLLDLEIYCDTQGHIRVRFPQYNKMPSSVFYQLFRYKDTTGVQLFPQFLEDMFVNQLKSLQNNFEVIEDQIRLDCALLGASTDTQCYNFIIRAGSNGNQFAFLTDESTGSLSSFNGLYQEANPEIKIDSINNTISGQLETQASIGNTFSTSQRAKFLVDNFVTPILTNSQVHTQIAQTRLAQIQSRLESATGQKINIDQFEINNFATATGNTISNGPLVPDVFKITNDLAQKLAQRQNLVKQLAKALNNAQEAISLDSTTNQQTANKLQFPNITPNTQIPTVFENMIEDESYDDLGVNSGKRYIIEDYQIVSYTQRENIPEFTMVEVSGNIDLRLGNDELPTGTAKSVSGTSAGGNTLVSAAAVDYDLWRMYGFSSVQPIHAPFLSDPESQCAPYAATILSRNRKNILRANMQIAGNEYMQPGDVVYWKARDLLFYVASVSHSFSYGRSFQTSLELTYGHSPGDYIPTIIDVVGKLLYNNRDSTATIGYRQADSFNQQNVGCLILDKRGGEDSDTLLLGGSYGSSNAKVLNDILTTTYFAIQTNSDPNSTVKPSIELRVYYDSVNGPTIPDTTVIGCADIARQILIGTYNWSGPSVITQTGQLLDVDVVTMPSDSAVDVSGKDEYRSPSQKAHDMVRNIIATASTSSGNPNPHAQLNTTLFGYIIDVWITFTNVTTT